MRRETASRNLAAVGAPPALASAQERAGGRTLTAIAEGLNASRTPTAQGGRQWYPSTVRAALRPS